jgi:hypothetical protein
MRSILLCLALGGAAPSILSSQVPFDGCVDRAGTPIQGTVRRDISAAAIATRVDDRPVILWNQGNLQWARPITQLFVYLHECGHHALGHLYKANDKRWEREADCWAMQMLIDGGMINGSDEASLTRELSTAFRGDSVHLSGDATVRDTRACIAARTDRGRWRAALDSLTAAIPDTLRSIVGQRMYELPGERYESLLDLPGTFDCEIDPSRMFRCPLFATPSARRARRRYDDLVEILGSWLPSTWSAVERPGTGYVVRQYVAEDGRVGSRITLALTDASTIFFVLQPYTE